MESQNGTVTIDLAKGQEDVQEEKEETKDTLAPIHFLPKESLDFLKWVVSKRVIKHLLSTFPEAYLFGGAVRDELRETYVCNENAYFRGYHADYCIVPNDLDFYVSSSAIWERMKRHVEEYYHTTGRLLNSTYIQCGIAVYRCLIPLVTDVFLLPSSFKLQVDLVFLPHQCNTIQSLDFNVNALQYCCGIDRNEHFLSLRPLIGQNTVDEFDLTCSLSLQEIKRDIESLRARILKKDKVRMLQMMRRGWTLYKVDENNEITAEYELQIGESDNFCSRCHLNLFHLQKIGHLCLNCWNK